MACPLACDFHFDVSIFCGQLQKQTKKGSLGILSGATKLMSTSTGSGMWKDGHLYVFMKDDLL